MVSECNYGFYNYWLFFGWFFGILIVIWYLLFVFFLWVFMGKLVLVIILIDFLIVFIVICVLLVNFCVCLCLGFGGVWVFVISCFVFLIVNWLVSICFKIVVCCFIVKLSSVWLCCLLICCCNNVVWIGCVNFNNCNLFVINDWFLFNFFVSVDCVNWLSFISFW